MCKCEPETDVVPCQIQSVSRIHPCEDGNETARLPLGKRMRLAMRRRISPHWRRKLKKTFTNLVLRLRKGDRNKIAPTHADARCASLGLKAGDRVRIRSREEIQGTLNRWGELKGCGFMTEMWQFCGTEQRVLKPVERFVDERDYQVKKARGVILLEGVTCHGTEFYGPCDRSCFLFWREEWLEKINGELN